MKKVSALLISVLIILLIPQYCLAKPSSAFSCIVIDSISPTSHESGSFDVVISGSNLNRVKQVNIGDAITGNVIATAAYTTNGRTQLTASVNLAPGYYWFQGTGNFGTSNVSPTLSVVAPVAPVSVLPPVPDPAPAPDPAPDPSTAIPTMNFSLSLTSSSTPQTLTLAVTLSCPVNQLVMADYTVVSGASAQIVSDPSMGSTIASGQVTFQPGTTQTSVSTPVNTEVDKAILVTLANPVNAQFEPTSLSANQDQKVLVIAKDALFGAQADGLTDDTGALQKAVNFVYANGGGLIIFPAGTYMVTSVNIRENITYQGLGNAIIKRPSMQPNWTRTFTNQNDFAYSGDVDSPPLIIKGLTFDGNSQNQGSYNHHELEQSMLLFLMGNAANPGKLRVIVESCNFINGVSDGISVYNNVDISVYNCTAENVFRGGFVLTGGYTKAYLKNFTTKGAIDPSGIDIEVDGVGYGGSYRVDVILEDVNCIDGDIDLGFHDMSGSTLKATRVTSGCPPEGQSFAFSFYGSGDGIYEFTDCTFFEGFNGNSGTNCCYHPGTATFTRCTFISSQRGTQQSGQIYSFPLLYWNSGSRRYTNQIITFNNCTFTSDNTVDPTIPKYGLRYTDTDQDTENNRLVFNDCIFTNKLDTAVKGDWGGKLIFNNSYFNVACRYVGGEQRYPIWLLGYDLMRNWDVTIDNCTFNTANYIYIYGYSDPSLPCTQNYLRQGNIKINKASNVIGVGHGLLNNNFIGLNDNPILRLIIGTGSPGNMRGFKSADGSQFDVYKDITNPSYPIFYKCTSMEPYAWAQFTP